jgi:uncharacterized protein (DUF488 family)
MHPGSCAMTTSRRKPKLSAARTEGNPKPLEVFTIGHSTRSLDELVGILRAHGIRQLIDVRTVPRSRTNPQFNADVMGASLAPFGIRYEHMSALGGLRKPLRDSPNDAWENASFRGYADYMQTRAFEEGLEALLARAHEAPTVIMCAEAVPWRCHRSLVADALSARGVAVVHLMSETKTQAHRVTRFAHVEGTLVTYPA